MGTEAGKPGGNDSDDRELLLWGYQYAYDAWGNLLSQAGWSPTYNACTQTNMAGVTADGNNHISGLTYDTSGNTQTDGNNTYTWDGESQLKTAAGVTYNYDGDGRRAAKVGSKLYWYGSGGEILSETDAAGNTINDYIFFGGKRVALVPASGSALYYAEDTLGSSRVIVQSNGTLCYDADFIPFGGEKTQTSTCAQNYKFEGKERDTETQNDDFGARYYSWRIGRWLSSDWSAVPVPVPYANLTNPQTLNLYAMVSDDPESFADLDGHYRFAPGTSPADKQAFRNALDDIEGVVGWTLMGATGSSLGQGEALYDAQVMQDSVDAYGHEGDNNGVTVAFAPDASEVLQGKDANTSAEHQFEAKTTETVTFRQSLAKPDPKSKVSLEALVVHEGTHVSDFRNPLARSWDLESRAYHREAILLERHFLASGGGRGMASIDGVIVWAPGFTPADVMFAAFLVSIKQAPPRNIVLPKLPGD